MNDIIYDTGTIAWALQRAREASDIPRYREKIDHLKQLLSFINDWCKLIKMMARKLKENSDQDPQYILGYLSGFNEGISEILELLEEIEYEEDEEEDED